MDPFFLNSPGLVNLLASQSSQTIDLGCSEVPKPASKRKWTTKEDVVQISAWLNTSKDPIVSNEQKAAKFWKRIEEYVNASPLLIGSVPREWSQCKQRWGRVNEQVCKSVGSHEAALKEQPSGQNENDVMKAAHDIFFNDYHLEVAARVAESDSPSSDFLVWVCLGVVFGSYPPPWCLGENSLSSALKLSFCGCLHQGMCRFIPIWWCQIVVSDGACGFLVLGSCGGVWKGTRARVCSLLVLGSLGSFFIGFSSSFCHRWLSLESEESSLVLSGGMCGDFDKFREPSIALSSLHGGTFWTTPSQLTDLVVRNKSDPGMLKTVPTLSSFRSLAIGLCCTDFVSIYSNVFVMPLWES
ncbi:hypothetical protein F2Q69_00029848 [Brassica cretica]|uniref:Myb-like domain-containing protein n=1 Tax=Brassica cretica TaxID=69181 RepID=A0A8S9S7H8_BRACR|nr:hypothetical protein F2Q69_00029848 [Brassica cretica]